MTSIGRLSASYLVFYPNDAIRALHSFPTRRSSDLRQRLHARVRGGLVVAHRLGEPRLDLLLARAVTRMRGEELRRSEEHTSELQSHHDLVCRLLLEKKKK